MFHRVYRVTDGVTNLHISLLGLMWIYVQLHIFIISCY